MIRLTFFTCWLFFLLPSLCLGSQFPVYTEIKDNVKFWESIYSQYTTTQGVLHDKNDLSRVYMVVDLIKWGVPGSSKLNDRRLRNAKFHVYNILTNLSSGKAPRTKMERHIASLFPRNRAASCRKARQNIRVQIGQKERFHAGVIRSGRYLNDFRTIFASHGLPPELVYLAHVESAFNPLAKSKAGAAGMWQFTPATGKRYLKINRLVDERLDPHLSAHAAAKLLKENYRQLNNWPLALTAYNYGRAGMVRALNQHGTYPNIFRSYRQGYFKFAARNFYSEFLAAMRVAKRLGKNPAVFLDRPEPTLTYRLTRDMPIGSIRNTYRISKEDFARLNPALQKDVVQSRRSVPKGYLVRIPTKSPNTRQQIAQIKSTLRSKTSPSPPTSQRQHTTHTKIIAQQAKKPPTSSSKKFATIRTKHTSSDILGVKYVVRKGDSPYSVARKFGIPVDKLLLSNGKSAKDLLHIGEVLLIPTPTIGSR